LQLQKELDALDERLKRLDHISEDGITQRRQLLKVQLDAAFKSRGELVRVEYRTTRGKL